MSKIGNFIGVDRQQATGGGPPEVDSVSINGTPVAGQTLTVSYSISGTASVITRTWKRNGVTISTSTSSNNILLVSADAGTAIVCNIDADGVSNLDSAAANIYASLFDVASSADAPFALHLVRGANLNSPILKVRSVTAGAEGDLNFNSSHTVGMDSNVTITAAGTSGLTIGQIYSLTTFVNSGGTNQSAAVITWYGQSSNGYIATQATPSKQALIVSAGVLCVNPDTNKVALLFDGVDDDYDVSSAYAISSTGAFSSIYVCRPMTGNEFQVVFSQKSNASVFANFFSTNVSYSSFTIGANATFVRTKYAGIPYNTTKLLNVYYNGSGAGVAGNFSVKSNNATATQTSASGLSATANVSTIGSLGGTSFFKGYIHLVMSYNSNQTSNEATINGNLNTYYGLY